MNKKTIALAISILCLLVTFGSCSDSSSSNTPTVSEEWKVFQAKVLADTIAAGTYDQKISSESGNGIVYNKNTTMLKSGKESRITAEGKPHFNDSVRCRYTGWLILQSGEQYIFDSTERDTDNAKDGRGFRVNSVIDGWTTILQDMKAGEERTICLPYQLGYGTAGTYNATTGVVSIPGYSTLFFTVKLLEIYPINPDEFPK